MHASDCNTRFRDRGTSTPWLGSRILIVEDDPAFATLLQCSLIRSGYEVAVAATVGDALNRLRQKEGPPFDLVIADVRLPRQSGVELLFPDDRVNGPPDVLMMTAFASRELKTFLRRMGLSLLEKPFSLDLLRARVMELLLRRQWHRVSGPMRDAL